MIYWHFEQLQCVDWLLSEVVRWSTLIEKICSLLIPEVICYLHLNHADYSSVAKSSGCDQLICILASIFDGDGTKLG